MVGDCASPEGVSTSACGAMDAPGALDAARAQERAQERSWWVIVSIYARPWMLSCELCGSLVSVLQLDISTLKGLVRVIHCTLWRSTARV